MVRDPVRVEGLLALFTGVAELRPITPTQAVHDTELSIVMIDADDAVFALLAAFRRARAGLRLLVFGDHNDQRYIGRIVAAGAKGYLPHSASASEIEAAVAVIADGSIWAPRKVLASLIDTYSPDQPKRTEVARNLGISPRTVQSAVSRLLRKVGVENRVALTVRVMEQHLLFS